MTGVARVAPKAELAVLPSVDRVLGWESIAPLLSRFGRQPVLSATRSILEGVREELRAEGPAPDLEPRAMTARIASKLEHDLAPRMRRVINLTGTVLHTNLGRALLPQEAVEAVTEAMTGASNLEYDIESGGRGDRDDLVAPILAELTGCQAATVVNNNAAAVLLGLNTLARSKEVIVSRGEQIEIGGAFRLPEIMTGAGCRLREVGTTNRTHLRDYAEAIGPRTALVLKVHRSNYAITGFTADVDEAELGALCRAKGIPFMVDLGSGALVDLSRWGLPKEPTPSDALANGASIVTFSGDKLLGGPQAGIVVGIAEYVARIKKNPLKRALRVNKMTLAALESVLRLYRDPDRLGERLTTLRLLARGSADIRAMAERLLPTFAESFGERVVASVEDCASQIGSGAQPVERLASAAIVLRPAEKRGAGSLIARMESALRELPQPVLGRVEDGALRLDLRCLEDEAELAGLVSALAPRFNKAWR